jgi:hypothetical protein
MGKMSQPGIFINEESIKKKMEQIKNRGKKTEEEVKRKKNEGFMANY